MAKSSANITVTGTAGAGETVTTVVLNAVQEIKFDVEGEMLRVKKADGYWAEFPLNPVATVTYTVAANVATVAVS